MLLHGKQFPQRPYPTGDAGFHCWRTPDCAVDPAHVPVSKMQGARGFQVGKFFRVSIRQSGQTADGHSQLAILRLDQRRAYVPGIRTAIPYLDYRFYHRSGRVPTCRVMLPVVAKQFYDLSEVCLTSENIFDPTAVEHESIGAQLEAVFFCQPTTQRIQELVSSLTVALAHSENRNQFGVRVEANENPCVSEFIGFPGLDVALFLAYESPCFISFNALAAKIPHLLIHNLFAALTRENQKPHDRIAVKLRNALRTTNRSTFKQKLNRKQRLIFRHRHGTKQTGVTFGVCPLALRAAESSQAVSVRSKLLALAITSRAIHVDKLQQALAVCQAILRSLQEITAGISVFRPMLAHTGGVI